MDEVDIAQEYEEKMRDSALARHKNDHPVAAEIDNVICQDCGKRIPVARRRAQPGCTLCVDCQRDAEIRQRAQGGQA